MALLARTHARSRRDDKVASCEALDRGADCLDLAHALVARRRREGRLSRRTKACNVREICGRDRRRKHAHADRRGCQSAALVREE